jgi:hypothetical protein
VSLIYQGDLGRLRVRQETSYGTDMTGSMGSWADVPAVRSTAVPKRSETIVQPGHLRQRLDQRDPGVQMPREARFPFSTNLETISTVGGDTIAPEEGWLGVMLECGLGGKVLTTGTTIASTSTTTSLNLTSAASHRPGAAVAIVNSAGRIEIREIKSVAANNVVLKHALSNAPANGTVVFGVATYYLHNNPAGADPIYAQFAWEGYNPKDRWVFPGGAFGSFGFEGLQPKGIPRIKWDWLHPTWLKADGVEVTADLRASALARASYSHIGLSTVRGAYYYLRAKDSSSLGTPLNAPGVEVAPRIEYEALETPGGGSGLCANTNCFGYRRIDQEEAPVDVNLDVHWENDTTLDGYHDNRTILAFTAQIGTSQSIGGSMISVPALQTKDAPEEIKIGGVRAKRLMLEALDDTEAEAMAGESADDEACRRAALRIHFTGPTA